MPVQRSEIEQALECPIDWRALTGAEEPAHNLAWLDWYYCQLKVCVGVCEQIVISDMVQEGDPFLSIDDPDEQKSVLINIRERRQQALDLFENRGAKPGLRVFLGPSSSGGKHFVPGKTPDEVITRSKSGPSLFFTDHSASTLMQAFWHWCAMHLGIPSGRGGVLDSYEAWNVPGSELYDLPEATLWRRLLQDKEIRIACDNVVPIGGSNGKGAEHVCFEIGRQLSHAYPVTNGEAVTMMGTYGVTISKAL